MAVVVGFSLGCGLCACGNGPHPLIPVAHLPTPKPAHPNAAQLTIWLTGYSWQDNSPPGSSTAGEPLRHRPGSGQGSYDDPITVAVPGDPDDVDWATGTRFYLPTVKRYVIVEDTGASDGPDDVDTHLDMWIDGQDATATDIDNCESQLTNEEAPAVLDPPPDLPVILGPIYTNHTCNIPTTTN